jgi:hypothetical protein
MRFGLFYVTGIKPRLLLEPSLDYLIALVQLIPFCEGIIGGLKDLSMCVKQK